MMKAMRQTFELGMFALIWLTATGTGEAVAPGPAADHYGGILARNVFGLKPAEAIPVPPPKPLPRITLTGITTIFGDKRVLLREQFVPGTPGSGGQELSLILAEGQRDGDVEVLEIDERAGWVRITNCGTPMTLTFEKDGAKLPATRPPVTAPPAPPGPAVAPQGSGVALRAD